MAIQFLPKDYNLVEVVEATREIVSGVRYELLVAALDENDEYVLCRIVVTEITWKVTAWGDKQRDLNYSNCTSNATTNDNVPKSNDFNFNPLFVRKTNFINDEDLKSIESQILNPKQTEKSASKPKTSEMSDFDLSNLEAMIIPSKSLVKTKAVPKIPNDLTDHIFDMNTYAVSESKTETDCNQSFEKEYLSKAQILPETQIGTDFIDDATTNKIYDYATGVQTKTLSEKKSTSETENLAIELSATESGQQDNTPKEQVETTLTSEEVDTDSSFVKDVLELTDRNDEQYEDTERIDVGTNTETTILHTHTLPKNEATESEMKSIEEGATLLQTSKGSSESHESSESSKENSKSHESSESHENSEESIEQIQQKIESEESIEQIQPVIESIGLQMKDSVVTSAETVLVFEKLTEENIATNEYSTELYKNQEINESRKSDRTKRDTNTEMQFLEDLTNEALEQLDHVDSDSFKRIVLDIIRVKKIEQENGAIYVIKVRTANSDCLEKSDDRQTCLDNVIKDTTKICFIEVNLIDIGANENCSFEFGFFTSFPLQHTFCFRVW